MHLRAWVPAPLGTFVQSAAAVCAWECWRRCCCCCRKGHFPIWSLCWCNSLDSVCYWVSYLKCRKSCVNLGAAPVCAWGRCCALAPLLLVLPEKFFAIWGLRWRNFCVLDESFVEIVGVELQLSSRIKVEATNVCHCCRRSTSNTPKYVTVVAKSSNESV